MACRLASVCLLDRRMVLAYRLVSVFLWGHRMVSGCLSVLACLLDRRLV